MNARFWVATHAGSVHAKNEDAYICRPEIGLFAVADGVGGCAGGGFASQEVVSALQTLPDGMAPAEILPAVRKALQRTHQRLFSGAGSGGAGQAATTIVVLLLNGDHIACLWAGDSRAYLVRQGRLHGLTADHSLVGEMLRAGELTETQAQHHPKANIITRAIGGASEGPLVDKSTGFSEPGDCFLLCTDGLSRVVDPTELVALVNDPDPADTLVKAALAKKTKDNVTALVVLP